MKRRKSQVNSLSLGASVYLVSMTISVRLARSGVIFIYCTLVHFCSDLFCLQWSLCLYLCVLNNPLKRRKGEESPFTAPTHPISPGTGDPHGWRRTPRTNLLVSPSFAIHGNYLWHFRGALTYSMWLHQPQIKTHIFETWNCTLVYRNLLWPLLWNQFTDCGFQSQHLFPFAKSHQFCTFVIYVLLSLLYSSYIEIKERILLS